MKWRLIDKSKTAQPKGKYTDWKAMLAVEGGHMCIYCTICDAHYGGMRNFHVEHYRPKSLFEDLEHQYSNLFYACGICNTFKGDDWPSDPTSDTFDYVHYPDPSQTDYSKLFVVDPNTALVSGTNIAAKYMVEKLNLNRAQILRNRKLLLLGGRLAKARDELREASQSLENAMELRAVIELLTQISQLFEGFWLAVPYEGHETRRQVVAPA